MGQEYAVFTVGFSRGGGPVIRTRHYALVIKDCEFIMFNLMPAVGADEDAGSRQLINHRRFMPGHSSVRDDADTGAPLVGGDNGIRNFRIGYGIDGNINGCGPIDFCNYAVFAFGAGGEI